MRSSDLRRASYVCISRIRHYEIDARAAFLDTLFAIYTIIIWNYVDAKAIKASARLSKMEEIERAEAWRFGQRGPLPRVFPILWGFETTYSHICVLIYSWPRRRYYPCNTITPIILFKIFGEFYLQGVNYYNKTRHEQRQWYSDFEHFERYSIILQRTSYLGRSRRSECSIHKPTQAHSLLV